MAAGDAARALHHVPIMHACLGLPAILALLTGSGAAKPARAVPNAPFGCRVSHVPSC